MAVTFIGLLCMQIFYMHNMLKMRYDQFSVGAPKPHRRVAKAGPGRGPVFP